MGYTYRGTQFDAHIPLPPMTAREVKGFNPDLCGTRSGYVQHRRLKEAACGPCREANAAYLVDYRVRAAARQIKKGWTGETCGTVAGYSAHRRHGLAPCDDCREASAQYHRDKRAAKQEAA